MNETQENQEENIEMKEPENTINDGIIENKPEEPIHVQENKIIQEINVPLQEIQETEITKVEAKELIPVEEVKIIQQENQIFNPQEIQNETPKEAENIQESTPLEKIQIETTKEVEKIQEKETPNTTEKQVENIEEKQVQKEIQPVPQEEIKELKVTEESQVQVKKVEAKEIQKETETKIQMEPKNENLKAEEKIEKSKPSEEKIQKKENLTKTGKKRGRPPKSKNNQNLVINTTKETPSTSIPKTKTTPPSFPDFGNSPRMTERQQMMLIMRSEQKNYKEFSSGDEMEEEEYEEEEEDYQDEEEEEVYKEEEEEETIKPVKQEIPQETKKRGRKKKIKTSEICSFELSCKGESLGIVKMFSEEKISDSLLQSIKKHQQMNVTKLISIEKLLQDENELIKTTFEAQKENDQESLKRIYSKLERDNMAGMIQFSNFFLFFIPPTEIAVKRFKIEEKNEKLFGAVFYLNDVEMKHLNDAQKKKQEHVKFEEPIQSYNAPPQVQMQSPLLNQSISPMLQQTIQTIQPQLSSWNTPTLNYQLSHLDVQQTTQHHLSSPIISQSPLSHIPMMNPSSSSTQMVHPYKMIQQQQQMISPYSQIQRESSVKFEQPPIHPRDKYLNSRDHSYDKYERDYSSNRNDYSSSSYSKNYRDRSPDPYERHVNGGGSGNNGIGGNQQYKSQYRDRSPDPYDSRQHSGNRNGMNNQMDDKPKISALEQFTQYNDKNSKKNRNTNQQDPKRKRSSNYDDSPSKRFRSSPPLVTQTTSPNGNGGGEFYDIQRSPSPSSNRTIQDRLTTLSKDSKQPTRHLWVGRFFNVSMDKNMLRKDFERFGPIESLNLLKDQKCAFINFENVEDAIRSKKTLEGTKAYPKIAYQQVRKNK
jgi:hypothetical protein